MPTPPQQRPIVVLDRDGVINRDSDAYIKSVGEWQPLPGSLEAIAMLCAHGFRVFVASNQSGIGRGLFDEPTLDRIHKRMKQAVRDAGGELSGIFICPHHPDDGCECRKPKPGLLKQVEAAAGASVAGQPVIGDSARDIAAARAVGARPILVRTGNGDKTLAGMAPGNGGTPEVYDDLLQAARVLIAEGG